MKINNNVQCFKFDQFETSTEACKECDDRNDGKSFPLGVVWGFLGVKAAQIGLEFFTGGPSKCISEGGLATKLDTKDFPLIVLSLACFGLAAHAAENFAYHLKLKDRLNDVKHFLSGNRQPTFIIQASRYPTYRL